MNAETPIERFLRRLLFTAVISGFASIPWWRPAFDMPVSADDPAAARVVLPGPTTDAPRIGAAGRRPADLGLEVAKDEDAPHGGR